MSEDNNNLSLKELLSKMNYLDEKGAIKPENYEDAKLLAQNNRFTLDFNETYLSEEDAAALNEANEKSSQSNEENKTLEVEENSNQYVKSGELVDFLVQNNLITDSFEVKDDIPEELKAAMSEAGLVDEFNLFKEQGYNNYLNNLKGQDRDYFETESFEAAKEASRAGVNYIKFSARENLFNVNGELITDLSSEQLNQLKELGLEDEYNKLKELGSDKYIESQPKLYEPEIADIAFDVTNALADDLANEPKPNLTNDEYQMFMDAIIDKDGNDLAIDKDGKTIFDLNPIVNNHLPEGFEEEASDEVEEDVVEEEKSSDEKTEDGAEKENASTENTSEETKTDAGSEDKSTEEEKVSNEELNKDDIIEEIDKPLSYSDLHDSLSVAAKAEAKLEGAFYINKDDDLPTAGKKISERAQENYDDFKAQVYSIAALEAKVREDLNNKYKDQEEKPSIEELNKEVSEKISKLTAEEKAGILEPVYNKLAAGQEHLIQHRPTKQQVANVINVSRSRVESKNKFFGIKVPPRLTKNIEKADSYLEGKFGPLYKVGKALAPLGIGLAAGASPAAPLYSAYLTYKSVKGLRRKYREEKEAGNIKEGTSCLKWAFTSKKGAIETLNVAGSAISFLGGPLMALVPKAPKMISGVVSAGEVVTKKIRSIKKPYNYKQAALIAGLVGGAVTTAYLAYSSGGGNEEEILESITEAAEQNNAQVAEEVVKTDTLMDKARLFDEKRKIFSKYNSALSQTVGDTLRSVIPLEKIHSSFPWNSNSYETSSENVGGSNIAEQDSAKVTQDSIRQTVAQDSTRPTVARDSTNPLNHDQVKTPVEDLKGVSHENAGGAKEADIKNAQVEQQSQDPEELSKKIEGQADRFIGKELSDKLEARFDKGEFDKLGLTKDQFFYKSAMIRAYLPVSDSEYGDILDKMAAGEKLTDAELNYSTGLLKNIDDYSRYGKLFGDNPQSQQLFNDVMNNHEKFAENSPVSRKAVFDKLAELKEKNPEEFKTYLDKYKSGDFKEVIETNTDVEKPLFSDQPGYSEKVSERFEDALYSRQNPNDLPLTKNPETGKMEFDPKKLSPEAFAAYQDEFKSRFSELSNVGTSTQDVSIQMLKIQNQMHSEALEAFSSDNHAEHMKAFEEAQAPVVDDYKEVFIDKSDVAKTSQIEQLRSNSLNELNEKYGIEVSDAEYSHIDKMNALGELLKGSATSSAYADVAFAHNGHDINFDEKLSEYCNNNGIGINVDGQGYGQYEIPGKGVYNHVDMKALSNDQLVKYSEMSEKYTDTKGNVDFKSLNKEFIHEKIQEEALQETNSSLKTTQINEPGVKGVSKEAEVSQAMKNPDGSVNKETLNRETTIVKKSGLEAVKITAEEKADFYTKAEALKNGLKSQGMLVPGAGSRMFEYKLDQCLSSDTDGNLTEEFSKLCKDFNVKVGYEGENCAKLVFPGNKVLHHVDETSLSDADKASYNDIKKSLAEKGIDSKSKINKAFIEEKMKAEANPNTAEAQKVANAPEEKSDTFTKDGKEYKKVKAKGLWGKLGFKSKELVESDVMPKIGEDGNPVSKFESGASDQQPNGEAKPETKSPEEVADKKDASVKRENDFAKRKQGILNPGVSNEPVVENTLINEKLPVLDASKPDYEAESLKRLTNSMNGNQVGAGITNDGKVDISKMADDEKKIYLSERVARQKELGIPNGHKDISKLDDQLNKDYVNANKAIVKANEFKMTQQSTR